MSGIVGGINLRSSGLVNNSSASDGQVFTGTGAGLPAGFEAAAGGGKVLQCLQDVLTAEFSTSSTTFVDTGLSQVITPATTSSKILLIASVSGGGSHAAAECRIRFSGTSTAEAYIGDAAGLSGRAASFGMQDTHGTTNFAMTIVFLDSGFSDTSAITYKLQLSTQEPSSYLNRMGDTSTGADMTRAASSLTVIEIGA